MNQTERKLLRSQTARASKLPDTFLLCRLVGHAWQRIVPDRSPQFGRLVVWQCARCEAKRDDCLAPDNGSLLARSYRYPDGYLMTNRKRKGERRGGRQLSAPALRIALLRRDDEHDATMETARAS